MKRKRKRKRVKPHTSMEVSVRKGPMKPDAVQREIEEIGIYAWCPDSQAKAPYEQVHLTLKLARSALAHVMRFTGPKTLGFFIEELAKYRRIVWPNCEPILGEEVDSDAETNGRDRTER